MVCALVCSLAGNEIGDEGATKLAEGLKANKTLTELKYATPAPPKHKC